MTQAAEPTWTYDDVRVAITRAVDDLAGALELPGHGQVDLFYLLQNAALTYLRSPEADLATVAQACYSEDLDTVLGWSRS
jgi:hypothetical protein